MSIAAEHLLLRLRPITRALREAVARQTVECERLKRPNTTAVCVSADNAARLMDSLDATSAVLHPAPVVMTASEIEAERVLRSRTDGPLPLDVLEERFGLTTLEMQSLLVCAAPEVDRRYERIFAFVHDDFNCRFPSIGLLCSIGAHDAAETLMRRPHLAPWGTLRRYGLLVPVREAETELRLELRLGAGLAGFLSAGEPLALSAFRDSGAVEIPNELFVGSACDCAEIAERVASGTRIVGVWGPPEASPFDVVMAVAEECDRPLRRVRGGDATTVQADIQTALALNAMLCFDSAEPPAAECLRECPVPLMIYGATPWRPVQLLQHTPYFEVTLQAPRRAERIVAWRQVAPSLADGEHAALADRHQLSGTQMRAVAQSANGRGRLGPLEQMCEIVVRQNAGGYTTLIQPRRKLEDLVLPKSLHDQVAEVGRFYLGCARVAEDWGFGKVLTGPGGLKVLFTGEPGTGKTMAAEVIAGGVGLPLLRADLSRLVSKWVGETEKNLESVFSEAEGSQCVLFFDEADSLFGKRGEVRAGADRYANLEIGFVLQRLESFGGLAILASNLRDQIDQAFVRRFDIILHFPMPGPAERRLIWRKAFRPEAPLDASVDFDSLSQLEMSGASIVSAARTSALLAIDGASCSIALEHVQRAISRQFGRESRIWEPPQQHTQVRPRR